MDEKSTNFFNQMWKELASPLTLSPEQMDKKISDLRLVEGWLSMNLQMIQNSIAALETQKQFTHSFQNIAQNMMMAGAESVFSAKPNNPSDRSNSTNFDKKSDATTPRETPLKDIVTKSNQQNNATDDKSNTKIVRAKGTEKNNDTPSLFPNADSNTRAQVSKSNEDKQSPAINTTPPLSALPALNQWMTQSAEVMATMQKLPHLGAIPNFTNPNEMSSLLTSNLSEATLGFWANPWLSQQDTSAIVTSTGTEKKPTPNPN